MDQVLRCLILGASMLSYYLYYLYAHYVYNVCVGLSPYWKLSPDVTIGLKYHQWCTTNLKSTFANLAYTVQWQHWPLLRASQKHKVSKYHRIATWLNYVLCHLNCTSRPSDLQGLPVSSDWLDILLWEWHLERSRSYLSIILICLCAHGDFELGGIKVHLVEVLATCPLKSLSEQNFTTLTSFSKGL